MSAGLRPDQARATLAGPLVFGDPEQIAAVRLLSAADEARALAEELGDVDPGECTECAGEGELECEECEGAGELSCTCDECHDTHYRECRGCDGKGVIPCDVCNGGKGRKEWLTDMEALELLPKLREMAASRGVV